MSDIRDWLDQFSKPQELSDVKRQKSGHKLELSLLLRSLDQRDIYFYDRLSDEDKKEVGFWILTRFISSSQKNTEGQLTLINDIVNVDSNVVSNHPELQWMTMAICGPGFPTRHDYIKPPKKANKNNLEIALSKLNPLKKKDEIEFMIKINSNDELINYFENCGYDTQTINSLF